jgi:hypothetical protein
MGRILTAGNQAPDKYIASGSRPTGEGDPPMRLAWVVLAAVVLAGCAVVPVPYPYDPYVAAPSVSVGVGVPVYRGGHGHRHHHHWGHRGYGGHGHYRRW